MTKKVTALPLIPPFANGGIDYQLHIYIKTKPIYYKNNHRKVKMLNELRNFLTISYDELEEMNIKAKKRRVKKTKAVNFQKEYTQYLQNEKRIKAITLCFSDLEGRFHMLDYDKNHFLKDPDNLTFDGSSIRGFSSLAESDLYLAPDWATMRWLPADIFGPGKVVMFANMLDRNKNPHPSDFRAALQLMTEELARTKGIDVQAAPEIEGFLVEGVDAEQQFDENTGFELISTGGYYHSLPKDRLRQFIDEAAEAQRAMGFENEKDHPEVAPSQFELNFHHSSVLEICDQIQLYKLLCRQVANNLGVTATFLPKPVSGINGNGMHINLSLFKNGKNMFYDKKGEFGLSKTAHSFISRVLNHAGEICLILNSSVNAYRRLDPNFEAPNQIKVSPTDRGSMIRIPMGNENSTRIEIRSVAPDANPYLTFFTLLKTGFEGEPVALDPDKRIRVRFLPDSITDALRQCKASTFVSKIMGEEAKNKYIDLKQAAADRSPKALGNRVKNSEIRHHHEVTNQVLWHDF